MSIEKKSELQNATKQVIKLHGKVTKGIRFVLGNAIAIGEILCRQKKALPHGDFTLWITKELPFSDRAARNYMRLYRNKDMLKTENVSVLTDAYKLLTAPKTADDDQETAIDDSIKNIKALVEEILPKILEKYDTDDEFRRGTIEDAINAKLVTDQDVIESAMQFLGEREAYDGQIAVAIIRAMLFRQIYVLAQEIPQNGHNGAFSGTESKNSGQKDIG
jgi:hypothetical protein